MPINDYGGWPVYVPVAQRRQAAAREIAAMKEKGRICQPVTIEGRAIALSFWGKSWCEHLESHSDFENRLPRGRTYARNGSVIDLQISAGKVNALVMGSTLYKVSIRVQPLERELWQEIRKECAGKVASLVELLQGRLSNAVMEIVTRQEGGLFPHPKQIGFRCSCPDGARMCKHVAAVLYGIGARLDAQPELLFLLRAVDPQELAAQTADLTQAMTPDAPAPDQRLEGVDLSALFGIELDAAPAIHALVPVVAKEASVHAQAAPKPDRERARKAAAAPKRIRTITTRALAERGIPYHRIQSWLKSGLLARTGTRGVYQLMKGAEREINASMSAA